MTTVAGSQSPQALLNSRYPEAAGPMTETAAGTWAPGAPGPRPHIEPLRTTAEIDADYRAAAAKAERKAGIEKTALDAVAKALKTAEPDDQGTSAPARRPAARRTTSGKRG